MLSSSKLSPSSSPPQISKPKIKRREAESASRRSCLKSERSGDCYGCKVRLRRRGRKSRRGIGDVVKTVALVFTAFWVCCWRSRWLKKGGDGVFDWVRWGPLKVCCGWRMEWTVRIWSGGTAVAFSIIIIYLNYCLIILHWVVNCDDV